MPGRRTNRRRTLSTAAHTHSQGRAAFDVFEAKIDSIYDATDVDVGCCCSAPVCSLKQAKSFLRRVVRWCHGKRKRYFTFYTIEPYIRCRVKHTHIDTLLHGGTTTTGTGFRRTVLPSRRCSAHTEEKQHVHCSVVCECVCMFSFFSFPSGIPLSW